GLNTWVVLCPCFWGAIAKDFFWKTKHTGCFLDYNFDVTKGEIFVKCMEGATTNICYNLLDRNVHERKLGDKIAFFWSVEGRKTDPHISDYMMLSVNFFGCLLFTFASVEIHRSTAALTSVEFWV
uniref:Acetyl-coenzyme A synthetase N-terminal domain-containing protein n=1 Tax=Poecilia mexicana TaxID=48701 RepID=A0A3B3XFK4_9TELE